MQQQRQQQARRRLVLTYSTPERVVGTEEWETIVTAILTEGRNAVDGEDVQFFIENQAYGAAVTTDNMGRAQVQVIIPAGRRNFQVSAQVVGEATSATQRISLPQEVLPQIDLEATQPQKLGDQYQVVAQARVARGNRPLTGVAVQFSVNLTPQGPANQTNNFGQVQQLLILPAAGGPVNISAEVVGTTARTNTVVEVPKLVKLSPNTIELEADGSLGLYDLKAIVTDETGKGVDGLVVFCSLRGAGGTINLNDQPDADGNYPLFINNEQEVQAVSGVATIRVQFLARWLTFRAYVKDRPGINAELKLRGPKGVQLVSLTNQEVRDRGLWGMVRDGIREGCSFSRERKRRRGRQ